MAKFLDETGLAELWSIIKASSARVVTGTYTGTGTYGSSNKCTLTFDFAPKLVIVSESHMGAGFGTSFNSVYGGAMVAVRHTTGVYGTGRLASKEGGTPNSSKEVRHTFTWGDKSFSWYTYTQIAGYYDTPNAQYNASGTTYYYLAIG